MKFNKQKYFNFILYFYIVYVFTSNIPFIELSFTYFKYLKYLSFLFFIFYIINFRISKRLNFFVFPFIILVFSSLFRFNQFSIQAFFNVIFYLTGIVLFLDKKHLQFPVYNAFYLSVFMALIFLIFSPDLFSVISFRYFIDPPDMPASLSYIFGFLSLIFLLEKKYSYYVVSILFMIVFPKRLIIYSTIIVSLICLFPFFFRKILSNKYFLIYLNLVYLIFTIFLANGFFNEYIIQNTGLQPGHFTSGRTSLYNFTLIKSQIFENFNWIWGLGEGYTVNLLKGNFGGIYLLHNDIFKILIEHGLIILILFSFFLYRNGCIKQKIIILFYNFLLFADNTLIYSFSYIFYFIALSHFDE
ncbi:hypothetical protein [Algoriphagus marincola]|uniref:hypothetical protein n=1 Tax=Algoriphagus marincola TaxID=264027 RepID=UPI00040D7E1B|nr:hypothetical protein [Algoriphagus marincola]